MSNRNIVVSGIRLGGFSEAASNLEESPTVATDLANAIGVSDKAMADGTEAVEIASDVEKAALLMQYNAAMQMLQDADLHPGVLSTVENPIAALIQSLLAERAESEDKTLAAPADGREAKFDERDVRWALSLVSWIGKLNPHDWQPPSETPDKVSGDFRMAITGDWGTGLYGAPEFKSQMLKQEFRNINYFVHLGDIYYAGTKKEAKRNFLNFWPQNGTTKSRACNGNHEMYSGGYGYFDSVLPEFGQTSSCFAMQNPNWLVVGLDSAYVDHDLAKNQNVWLDRLIRNAGERKVVLLSHHQPFSHFEHGGDKLIEKIFPILNSGRITAWYWGHEHRCVVYDRHPKWKLFGRCIGHGGYPYFREPSLEFDRVADPRGVDEAFWRVIPSKPAKDVPRALLLDGPNSFLGEHREDYGPNGFITLEFRGTDLIERYYLPNGSELPNVTVAIT